MISAREAMALAPVIPVLTIEDAATASDIARALVSGGLRVLEVTLRTPAALDAIARIAAEVEDAVPAAGTVLNARDLEAAARAGAQVAFSPGIAAFAAGGPIPVIPGVATASDIMAGLELGLDAFKFFPAAAAGGVAVLGAFRGPFAGVIFCPTGGISEENARDYLAAPNVACVGGSWLTPPAAIKAGDWAAIERLARRAAALRPSHAASTGSA